MHSLFLPGVLRSASSKWIEKNDELLNYWGSNCWIPATVVSPRRRSLKKQAEFNSFFSYVNMLQGIKQLSWYLFIGNIVE